MLRGGFAKRRGGGGQKYRTVRRRGAERRICREMEDRVRRRGVEGYAKSWGGQKGAEGRICKEMGGTETQTSEAKG